MQTEDIFRIISPDGETAFLIPEMGYDEEEQYVVIGATTNLFPHHDEETPKTFLRYLKALETNQDIGWLETDDIKNMQRQGYSPLVKVATLVWTRFPLKAAVIFTTDLNIRERKFFAVKKGETQKIFD